MHQLQTLRQLLPSSIFSLSAAFMYETCFDEALEERAEGGEEDEKSYASHISAPTSLPLSLGEGGTQGDEGATGEGAGTRHRDSGTCLEMEQQTPGRSYTRMSSSGRNSDSGTPFLIANV